MAAPSPSKGEGLRRDQKLCSRADFLRCYRRGKKRYGDLATLHFHPNRRKTTRLGITASRKVGKAVVRHRVKRRVREIFRRHPHRWDLPDVDIVVHLKPTASAAGFGKLETELDGLLSTLLDPSPHRGTTHRETARRREKARHRPRMSAVEKGSMGSGPRQPRARETGAESR